MSWALGLPPALSGAECGPALITRCRIEKRIFICRFIRCFMSAVGPLNLNYTQTRIRNYLKEYSIDLHVLWSLRLPQEPHPLGNMRLHTTMPNLRVYSVWPFTAHEREQLRRCSSAASSCSSHSDAADDANNAFSQWCQSRYLEAAWGGRGIAADAIAHTTAVPVILFIVCSRH